MKTPLIISLCLASFLTCLSAKSQTLQFSQVVTLSGILSTGPGGTPNATFSPPPNKVWKIESIRVPDILQIKIDDTRIAANGVLMMSFPIWIDSDDTIYVYGLNSYSENYLISIIEFNNQ